MTNSDEFILGGKIDYTRSVHMGVPRGNTNNVNFNQPVKNGNAYHTNKPKVYFTSTQTKNNGATIHFNQNHQKIK